MNALLFCFLPRADDLGWLFDFRALFMCDCPFEWASGHFHSVVLLRDLNAKAVTVECLASSCVTVLLSRWLCTIVDLVATRPPTV